MDSSSTLTICQFFFNLNASRNFLFNNAPFRIRGINYDTNYISGSSSNPWYVESGQLPFDSVDILNGGFNTVKIYGTEANSASHLAAMDAMLAVNPDLKFIVLDFVTYDTDYSVATGGANRTSKINDFVAMVNIFKNRPEVLMMGFGNENNLAANREDGTSIADWYSLVNAACAAGKVAAPSMKFFTVDAEVATYTGDSNLSNVDILGFNIYRGTTFTDLLQDIVSITSKPVFLSEFGIERADNSTQEQLDQANEDLALLQEVESKKPFIMGWVLFKWSHNDLLSQRYHIATPLAQGINQSKVKYTAYTTIKNYLTTHSYGG